MKSVSVGVNFRRPPVVSDKTVAGEAEHLGIAPGDPTRDHLRQVRESGVPDRHASARAASVLGNFPYADTDERIKVFAQGLLPERIKESGLEGWQIMKELEFTTTLAEGFVNFMDCSGFDSDEKIAFQRSIGALEEVKRNTTEMQVPFNKNCEKLIFENFIKLLKKQFPDPRKSFDATSDRLKIPVDQLMTQLKIPEDQLAAQLKIPVNQLMIPNELNGRGIMEHFAIEVLKGVRNELSGFGMDCDPYDKFLENEEAVKRFVSPLRMLKLRQQIIPRLKDEDSCIYLPSGWIGSNEGHCAYIILERKNGNLYAHEINSGAGLDLEEVGRHKVEGKPYSERSIPGRTIQFVESEGKSPEENLLEFVARNFALQVLDAAIDSSKREREYDDVYGGKSYGGKLKLQKKFGIVLTLDPTGGDVGRPRFTECLQRSGNCVMKSADIFFRTVLQRAMAKKMSLGTNDPRVIKRTNQLYRLYEIYRREQILRDYLAWCKDPKNKEVNRDSLSLLRGGVGRFGYYVNRYKGIAASEQRGEHLLQRANDLEREISEYLESDAAIKIMRQTNSPTPSLSTIPAGLAEEAKTKAQNYSCMPQIAQRPFSVEGHILLEKKQTELSTILKQAELIVEQIKLQGVATRSFECRKHELIEQAAALLRAIPLPNEQSWEEYKNLEESDRHKLMGQIHSIMFFLPSLRLAIDGWDQILPMRQNSYDLANDPVVVNAVTKARIIAFELAKIDPFLGEYIPIGADIDHSWFGSFCTSAANFHVSEEERNEQMRLFQYVNCPGRVKTHFSIKLFKYTSPTPLNHNTLNLSQNPTLVYYDEIIQKMLNGINYGALFDEVLGSSKIIPIEFFSATETMTELKPELDGSTHVMLRNHPGLFLYGDVEVVPGGRKKFLEGIVKQNPDMGKNLLLLENFRDIMSYGNKLISNPSISLKRDLNGRLDPSSCDVRLGKIDASDSLEEFGDGYALESENQAHISRLKDVKLNPSKQQRADDAPSKTRQLKANQPEIMRLIGEELSRPDVQSFGLLRLLEEHLELCDGFYCGDDKKSGSSLAAPPSKEKEDIEKKSLLFNLWLQAFNRVLYPKQGTSGAAPGFGPFSPSASPAPAGQGTSGTVPGFEPFNLDTLTLSARQGTSGVGLCFGKPSSGTFPAPARQEIPGIRLCFKKLSSGASPAPAGQGTSGAAPDPGKSSPGAFTFSMRQGTSGAAPGFGKSSPGAFTFSMRQGTPGAAPGLKLFSSGASPAPAGQGTPGAAPGLKLFSPSASPAPAGQGTSGAAPDPGKPSPSASPAPAGQGTSGAAPDPGKPSPGAFTCSMRQGTPGVAPDPGKYSLSNPESPLQRDALNHPKELLEAVSRLWETGKRELRGNIPDQNPSIKQLCALVHAVHITCNSIIASHDSGEILSDVGEKLGNILKDLESMRGGSLAYNEIMFLRLARNECIGGLWTIAQKNGEMVSDELLLEMYENTFWLQSFDCGRLPKGCSAVIYGLIPSLAPYWRQHPDQAQRIATAVYDSLVSSAGKVNGSDLKPVPDQIGQFEAPDGHHVDLISFRVYDSGNRVANAKEVFLHGDYERLFGDKAQKIVSTGNSHRFVDSDGYGDIVMLVLGGKDSKIYRKFEGSDDRWCYVSLDKISTVSLPRCFGGDDFTTWVDANGRFKICAKERPNEVLYESDEQGRLCDVIRREQGTVPYYISFDIPSQNDIFSRFEGTTYSLFYHDGNGVIQEIMLPRYHGKTGKPLRFHRDGENWVLHSNPSYQLIDAPSWSIGGEETKQNLLLGYEGALCLKNTDPKNGGAFKYLLPQHDISRSRGMTHQLTSCPPKTDCKSKFFSGARYAEVNLPTNDLDFIAPSLQETDGLSCLRLARIFQAQGEYGLAVQYLDKISSHGQFDGDEINALNSIIQGFKNGKEGSGLAALVPLKALSCLLRSSPFGTDSEEILNSLLENLAGVKPPLLECLVEQYLGDFDLQPKELRLNPQEELTLWHNVLALANPIVQRKEARERYNYNARFIEKVKSPIVARIDDLCRLKNPNSASLIKFTGIEIGNLKVIIERERPYFMRFARESVKAMEGIASKIRSKDFSFKGLDSIRALEQQIDVENNEFKNIKPAVDKVSEAIQLHIKNLSEVNSFKIKYLSNDAKEHVRQLLGQLSEQLDNFKEKAGKHLNDLQFLEQLKRLKALRREDMPLREAAQIEVGEGDAFDSLTSSMESALHGALLTLESSIFERSTGVPTGEAPKLDDLALSEEDKKQFGSRAVAFLEEFNGELAVGARQLQEISADPVASAVPEVGEISELLATANAQRSRAIKFAQSAARRIAEIGNRKRLETTHGADAWEPVKIPHALRAYGIFVSGGADGSKRALEYLQHAHPWFSAGKLHDFLLCTEAYLVSVNSARHLERVSAALAPLEEDGVPADSRAASWRDALPLLRQTRNDVVRNDGDNGLVGNMLLFEYMTGIRPREDQIEKMASIVNALVRGGDQHGALIQQIMGSGKTKVLLPFLIALLLNGQDNFPMIVSHISQLPAVMMELPAILGRIGIRLDLIDVDYSQFFNPEMIRALRQQLETAFAERNSVPVIASHTLLALRTAFRTLSEQTGSKESATTNDLYVEFNELFSFMEQKGIALMDEVHITLNPKESFIIQPPAVAKLDAKIAEKDVTSMVDIIYDLPRNLIAPIASNKQDQISPASLKNELRAHAAVTCGEQFGVPGSLRDAFAGFICGDFDGQEEAALPEDVRQWLDNLAPATKHRVCLLRKLCSSTLPQCLTKVYGEHYGYNDRGEVVPYRNRMPTNNHYKDPHEALCYYILATTTKGVPDITLGQWVGNLAKQGKEQVGSDMPFAQTNQAVLFERLFDGMDPRLSLLDAVDMQTSLGCPQTREGVLQSLQSFLGANPDKKKILAAELAQDQAGYFPRSYETTPLDISTVFHGTVSMSGTLSNRESYTRKVSSAVDLQRGALGKVACKLIQDSAAPNAAQPPKTQIVALPEATLDTVAGTLAGWKETVDDSKVKNLRIIVDYGAQFKDQPARQSVKNIADFIADSGNGAKYIEYFDPQLNGFAIVSVEDVCRDGLSFKAKKITNPVSDRPTESEELLTFLDTPHTTGTDPLMMLNGHGLTTLNVLQNDLDGFLQAVMRERKFLHANGQTMDIVLSEKAVQDVFSDGNVPAMPALIGRLARNTAASINRQQIQAATLQLRELPRRFIENKLRKCAASKNLKDLAKWRAATAELVASIDDFDVDSWGNARSWQSVRTILENQWAHTLGRLRNALSSLGDIAGEALAEIPALNSEGKAYIDAIREDAKILAFSRQGAVAVSDQEIQVEVQQQQQQQQEQELQLEMQLLHQILRGDANRRACAETALAHPAAPTPAWNVIGDWQGQSVAARLSTDHHRIGALPGKLRERYDDARSVFSSLSEEFSATRNFWETATTPESIFSPYQKSAKYLLLSWDNSTPPQNRCHFLSEYEAASVQKMIDDGSLTECHLCTATGSTLSQRGALKEGSEAFKEQALWVAHFFNGDTHWLETHPITTIEMFNRFGMPQAYQAEGNGERNKFLENIRHFLMLRSSDPKRTDAACKASLLLSTGQQRDLLASFLAEHALTERTSPHTIFSAIVDSFNDFNAAHNLPHWSIILLSALDKFDPHALINNQNFGTLLSQISGTQIFPTIKAAIDRIPHHRGSGS